VPQLRDMRPTGIPALDEERKTQGWVNFNHQGFRLVADQVLRDSLSTLRQYPGAYLRYVADNIQRYGLSREIAFPFTERQMPALVDRQSNDELVSACRKVGLSELGVVPWLKCGAFALLTGSAFWLALVGFQSGDRSMGICMLFALVVIAPS